jgi:WD40 repeat protein
MTEIGDERPRVFISYSHDSSRHAERVLKLSARLREDGIETILDRYESSPEEGWPRWMMRGIRDARFVLMICTRIYNRRVMGDEEEGRGLGVRWEGHLILQHLYDAGTRNRKFIAVALKREDIAFIPDPVRAYSHFVLATKRGYEQLYARLTGQDVIPVPTMGRLKQLSVPVRQWGDDPPVQLIRVPRLPQHYLARSTELASLKEKLLQSANNTAGRVLHGRQIGVQGMVGIGKTLLAAAVCQDAEVQRRYADGIVWLPFGQAANVEQRQIDLYECFSDKTPNFPDRDSARSALSRVLAGKRCLIVLDDVWSVSDAASLDVVGTSGAILITTRDAGVARGLGVDLVSLPVLSESQGLTLLAHMSGHKLLELPDDARAVVDECGRLPLAIAMIGGMVHGIADPWRAALVRLREYRLETIAQEFPDYTYPNLLRAIQVSIDALSPETRLRYGELAVFPEDVHVPECVIQLLWSAPNRDRLDLAQIFRELMDKSLVFQDEHRHVYLHDVQRAYLLRKAERLQTLHQLLVSRYRAIVSDGWASGPDDGYFFAHLVHHLAAAHSVEEALALITSVEWLSAQLRLHGLLAVLNDCWELASSPDSDDRTRRIAVTIRDTYRLSAHRLEGGAEELAEQLHGRLATSAEPEIDRLLTQSAEKKQGAWLRPCFASLQRPHDRLRRTITLPATPSTVVSLPDGRVAVGAGAVLYSYDLESGALLGELITHDAEICHATLSADRTLLASSSRDGVVKVLRVVDGSLLASLNVPQLDKYEGYRPWGSDLGDSADLPLTYIGRLAPLPGSMLLVGAIAEQQYAIPADWTLPPLGMWLIDCQSGSFSSMDMGHEANVTALAATPCGTRIVAGAANGSIRVWNRNTARVEHVFSLFGDTVGGPGSEVGDLVISPDGSRVFVSAASSGRICIWDLDSGASSAMFDSHQPGSVTLALSKDGQRLYVGGYVQVWENLGGLNAWRDSNIHIWDIRTQRTQEELHGHHLQILSMAVTADGDTLVSASADDTVRLWDLGKLNVARIDSAPAFQSRVTRIALHPSEDRFVAASSTATALFDCLSGEHLLTYLPPISGSDRVQDVCLSSDGRQLLFAIDSCISKNAPDNGPENDSRVDILDTASGRHVRRCQSVSEVDRDAAFFKPIIVTPDGRFAIALGQLYSDLEDGGDVNQALALWSLQSGSIEKFVSISTPYHKIPWIEDHPMTISADGRFLALTTVEEQFRLCDLQNECQLMTFGEHSGWIGGVVILQHIGLIVTAGGNDEAIRAWKIADGTRAWEWKNQGRVSGIAASPSERYLIVGTQANEIRISSVPDGATIVSFSLDAPVTALDVHRTRSLVGVGDETGRVHVLSVENCPGWRERSPQ